MNDTELGRWFVADPLAEKYYSISPYVFCANNPIIFVDSYGRDLKIYYKSNEGKTLSFTYTGVEKNIPNNSFVQSVVNAVNGS